MTTDIVGIPNHAVRKIVAVLDELSLTEQRDEFLQGYQDRVSRFFDTPILANKNAADTWVRHWLISAALAQHGACDAVSDAELGEPTTLADARARLLA